MKKLTMTPKAFKEINEKIEILYEKISVAKRQPTWDGALISVNKKEMENLKDFRNENCEIVNVHFSIGSRGYNEKTFKVGKYLFTCIGLTKLTKYYNPKIIPEITEQMKKETLDDLYYY